MSIIGFRCKTIRRAASIWCCRLIRINTNRKQPLCAPLFALAHVGCALSPDIPIAGVSKAANADAFFPLLTKAAQVTAGVEAGEKVPQSFIIGLM